MPPTPSLPPALLDFRFGNIGFTPDGGDPRRFRRAADMFDCRYDAARGALITAHGGVGVWPAHLVGPENSAVDSNQWFLVYRNNRWVAGVNEWVRPDQSEKAIPAAELYTIHPGVFYAPDRFGELFGWRPAVGEIVGVFCTTPARTGVITSPELRTDVWFLEVQPSGDMTPFVTEDEITAIQQPPANPAPPGSPTPTPTPVPTPTPTPTPTPGPQLPPVPPDENPIVRELFARLTTIALQQDALVEACAAVVRALHAQGRMVETLRTQEYEGTTRMLGMTAKIVIAPKKAVDNP